jgi:hypothetical protein
MKTGLMSRQKPEAVWVVLFAVWALAAGFPSWFLGPDSYVRFQDTLDSLLSTELVVVRSLVAHGFSYWQPDLSGGIPTMSLGIADSFLVNGLPYLLLPPWAGFAVVTFLQRFIGGYFVFRLCRDHLGMGAPAAIFGGICYSMLQWSIEGWTFYFQLGMPTAPLILWAFEKTLGRSWPRLLAWAAGLGLFFALVSPFATFTVFFWIGFGLWIIVRRLVAARSLAFFSVFVLASLSAEFPYLLGLAAYAPLSSRGALVSAGSIDVVSTAIATITDILPQFVVPVAVFLVGRAQADRPDSTSRRVFAAFLLVLLLTIVDRAGGNPAKLFLDDSIAVGVSLRHLKYVAFLFAAILGAAGIEALVARGGRRALLGVVTAFGTPVIVAGVIGVKELRMVSSQTYRLALENPQVVALASKTNTEPFRVATPGAFVPSVYFAAGRQYFPMFAAVRGLEIIDGYYELYSSRYFDLWQRMVAPMVEKDPWWQERVESFSLNFAYLFSPSDNRFDRQLSVSLAANYDFELLSLLNTRYLLSRWRLSDPELALVSEPVEALDQAKEWEGLDRLERIRRVLRGEQPDRAIFVYENKSVLPRAFLTRGKKVFPSSDSLLDALAQAPLSEIRDTVYLGAADFNDTPIEDLGFQTGSVRIREYHPDKLILDVETDGRAYLVVSNNYSPYWRASIDGEEARVVPAYHVFQGIAVAPGRHAVTLEYRPPYALF